MSRIKNLFQKKNIKVLNVYCTAGYPHLNSTLEVMKALQDNGADIIELGMPYSDPLADGPVIQASSTIALQNGMTIKKLFEQLKNFRSDSPSGLPGQPGRTGDRGITVPVLLMGYMNPVLQYGFEKFCADAAAVGIDGLIIPDLPEFEFESEYGPVIKKNNLDFIFLVTPETPKTRVRKLDALSSGFLYAVSSSSTTGSNKNMNDMAGYLERLKSYDLGNPVLAGFGIRDKKSFETACEHANGAIIGSAYIRILENSTDISKSTKTFLNSIL